MAAHLIQAARRNGGTRNRGLDFWRRRRPAARAHLSLPLRPECRPLVLVGPRAGGALFNAGTGFAGTEAEAHWICDAMVPPGVRERGPRCEDGGARRTRNKSRLRINPPLPLITGDDNKRAFVSPEAFGSMLEPCDACAPLFPAVEASVWSREKERFLGATADRHND